MRSTTDETMYNVKCIMYNESYAVGGGGSASSCMSVVDFIIHYTLYIRGTPSLYIIHYFTKFGSNSIRAWIMSRLLRSERMKRRGA